MAEFRIERWMDTAPEVIWEVLSDFGHSRSPNMKVELLEEGNPNDHQVGAVRRVEFDGTVVKEKLTAVDPGRFLTYQLLSGAPVKDYFGTIALRPENGGAFLEWRVNYRPKFPWPAFLINRTARKMIHRVLDDIEQAFSEPAK